MDRWPASAAAAGCWRRRRRLGPRLSWILGCWAAGLPQLPAGLHAVPCRRSPLWDQEDFYQREGCTAVNVVSMPFYWPPREGSLWQGAPLPVPQSQAFHPTFGAMTVAGSQPLTMP